MASIKDVAKASGVSPSTVSMVLNNRERGVSARTRERVLGVMRELNYKPSALFYGEHANKTKTLGVVLMHYHDSFRQHPYFVSVLDGILGATTPRHWNTLLLTELNWSNVPLSLRMYCDGRCDGLILISPPPDLPIIAALKQRGATPFVVINPSTHEDDVVAVDVENLDAGREITAYLIGQGHRRIAAFPGEEANLHARQRHEGYRQALAAAGIPFDESLVLSGSYFIDSGYERACGLLARPRSEWPTAIVCGTDNIAIGVMSALKEHGVRVPSEISVTGFDGIPAGETVEPALTTMRQPYEQLGESAVELLVAQIEGHGEQAGHKVYKPDLIVRKSTGPAPTPWS